MRRLLYYSLLCLLWISVDSCKDDEVAAPPKPSFTVDKTSGLYNATEFTFTIDQVAGNSISLLPYGVDNPSFGGISVPASSFTNGKATVKFTYAKIGTYDAVVVANNHATDGNSVKNVYSDAKAITITSDATKMTEFNIDKSTKAEFKNKVATDIDTFVVTMPYSIDGNAVDVAKLVGKFTTSDFSTVSVGSTAQESGKTVNDFTNPVKYTVKSQDAAQSTDYLVIVIPTAIETKNTFKSASAIVASKTNKGKVLQVSVDNASHILVVYDVQGTANAEFDSISLDYALNGSFAYAKYDGADKKMKAKDTVDLTTPKTIKVTPQDSTVTGAATYDVYATSRVPKLAIKFETLSPVVTGSADGFSIALSVLNGTTITAIPTTADYVTGLPTGVFVENVTVTEGDADPRAFVPGGAVDYSKPVKFELTVTDLQLDGGTTFKVYYTATVKVLK